MGGECNYVLRVARPSMRLEFVPDDSWKSAAMMSWADADIARLLSDAERVLAETAHRLRLPVQVSNPSYVIFLVTGFTKGCTVAANDDRGGVLRVLPALLLHSSHAVSSVKQGEDCTHHFL